VSLFKPMSREKRSAKVLITGPAGAGKTHTALNLMTAFTDNIAVAMTEPSAELYLDRLPADVRVEGFTMDRMDSERWSDAMNDAVDSGFGGIIMDSLSDEWRSTLNRVDSTMTRDGRQDNRAGWREIRPVHEGFAQAIQRCPIHVIATCRSKMSWDWEGSKKRALGYEPVQDNEITYWFDMVLDMDQRTATVEKVRGFSGAIGLSQHEPTAEFIRPFADWLTSGSDPTIGEPAMLRLRREYPNVDYQEIRRLVRDIGGVRSKQGLYVPGWFDLVKKELDKVGGQS